MATDQQFPAPANLGIAVYSNNAEAIGNTPLVRINRLIKTGATVLAKVESRNPAFSVKCRIGAALIADAEKRGVLKAGMQIVEPTSGNTGIALAFVAAAKGYPITLTMPASMSLERRKVLKALGADLVLTDPAKGMKGAVDEAVRLATENPEQYFLPQQFENPANPQIHTDTTGPEIWQATNGQVDILVAGVGTGGTITGISRYFEQVQNKALYSVAVEPAESPIITQTKRGESITPAPHKIQGIGANFIPKNLDLDLVDEVLPVNSADAIEWARKCATQEGILVGISSGAALAAAAQIAERPENAGKTIVVILPDSGERYLSSVLFEGLFDEA
ncbi:cysteine synthase [Acinetobacter gyllenbergii]|uniref:Cysteine synthase n=1 Tax=Acinetobacter gyllenbergii CIP 110306 = MTCC 11365 TaxID=1217657 RepID=A0A829HDQ4_9GAMM|nr:cysteine synthase A [Acinetobacter gyllenbergii]EPF73237.1 cysteine synthase A [Acinetobacter gyllenbergii CIP 110306 = MTCC 11365]EPH34627.1 Cysteine synthase [Acinetobacter gyllenbergii CIP 110306 = MTCC 11365]ESK38958.1 cysteine synthase A [Acinetobacter gyllenbergii NIPH 230]GMA10755.1 cysteine synthase [Acinetobacter gyllenbergii]